MHGEVVYLFAFDVSSEIVLSRVQSVLGQTPVPLDLRPDHTSPRDVPMHLPLSIEIADAFAIDGVSGRAQIRIFEVGVLSVLLRLPFDVEALDQLRRFHREGQRAESVAKDLCARAVADLWPAIAKPAPATEPEAYTIFCLTDLQSSRDTQAWLSANEANVAGLLSDLPADSLADPQIAEVLRHRRLQQKTDLVVVDWDAALIVELQSHYEDVLHVLELANLQLEEFKVMDRTLDRHLATAYALAERQPRWWIAWPSKPLRQLREMSVDLAKLADEVSHITKFLGDWYLARVYLAVRERFHLEPWRASVEKRLEQIKELYSVFQSEVNERRMLWLEIIIVVFFAIDLLAILVLRR